MTGKEVRLGTIALSSERWANIFVLTVGIWATHLQNIS